MHNMSPVSLRPAVRQNRKCARGAQGDHGGIYAALNAAPSSPERTQKAPTSIFPSQQEYKPEKYAITVIIRTGTAFCLNTLTFC